MIVEPICFGADGRLFGVFHPAADEREDAPCVVVCSSWGPEAIRSHRAFAVLSRTLAERGCHVLRFDFTGQGDSLGAEESISLAQWEADIREAVVELREGTDGRRVVLIGLRLGAALVLRVAGSDPVLSVDSVVCWDAVTNGGDYLAELDALHQEWHRGSFASQASAGTPANPTEESPVDGDSGDQELLGFHVTSLFYHELEKLDIKAENISCSAAMLWIATTGSPPSENLVHRLCPTATILHEPHPPVWRKGENDDVLGGALVPHDIVTKIADWILSGSTPGDQPPSHGR